MLFKLGMSAAVACFVGLLSSAHAEDGSWDKVIEAAKKEGKVVVYNMALGAPYFTAVLKSFEAKYGIPVEKFDLRASELSERIRTEQAAGRFLGDAEMVTTTMIEEQLKNGDFVQKLPPIPNAAHLRPPFKANEYSVPAFMQPMGILINTRLVKEQDIPTSWNDLNDPKWKGKILSDDMRPLGSGNTMFAILEKTMGTDFNQKLAEQKPVFSRDMRNDARRVARGEYAIYIPQIFAFTSDLKGLPVKVVDSEGGCTFRGDGSRGAQERAASQRCAFVHRPLPQRRVAIALRECLDASGERCGRRARGNPDAKQFVNAKIIGPAKLAERSSMMDLAKKLYP